MITLNSILNPDPGETFPLKKASILLLGFILKQKIQQVITTQRSSKTNPNPCHKVFSISFYQRDKCLKKRHLLTSVEMQKMEAS